MGKKEIGLPKFLFGTHKEVMKSTRQVLKELKKNGVMDGEWSDLIELVDYNSEPILITKAFLSFSSNDKIWRPYVFAPAYINCWDNNQLLAGKSFSTAMRWFWVTICSFEFRDSAFLQLYNDLESARRFVTHTTFWLEEIDKLSTSFYFDGSIQKGNDERFHWLINFCGCLACLCPEDLVSVHEILTNVPDSHQLVPYGISRGIWERDSDENLRPTKKFLRLTDDR